MRRPRQTPDGTSRTEAGRRRHGRRAAGAAVISGCLLGALLTSTEPARAADEEHFPWLDLDVRMGVLSRSLDFHKDRHGTLRSYELPAAPSGLIRLRWYPAARFTTGALVHLGASCTVEQMFSVDSKLGDNEFDTSSGETSCGPRARIPWDRNEVGIETSYGRHHFTIETEGRLLVPSVDYDLMRVGADVRLRVEELILGAHFGWRFVWSAGNVQSQLWFPHLLVRAMDGGYVLGFEASKQIDLLLGFDFRRYFFDLRSKPGDSATQRGMVAESAVDLYLTGWAGVTWRVPAEQD